MSNFETNNEGNPLIQWFTKVEPVSANRAAWVYLDPKEAAQADFDYLEAHLVRLVTVVKVWSWANQDKPEPDHVFTKAELEVSDPFNVPSVY